MKGFSQHLYIIGMTLALLFATSACDKDAHDGEIIIPEGQGALTVGVKTEGTDIPVSTAHLFIFGANERLQAHEYFENLSEMALHSANLSAGNYTVIAVMNVPADFMPPATRADLPDILLADFTQWLGEEAQQQPEMLTGMVQTEIKEGEVQQVTLTIKAGTEGIALPVLRVLFTTPEPSLPDYTPTRAAYGGYVLRCIVEACKAGTDEIVYHRMFSPTLATDGSGKYSFDMLMKENTYDIRLWTDYVPAETMADYYYITSDNLKAVTIQTEFYQANADSKDAAYAYADNIVLPEAGAAKELKLERPLAKYRLIATDVAKYRSMIKTNGYPPLEELTVSVRYEGYFPSGFNVTTGKPNDAVEGNKISYSKTLPALADTDTEVQTGSDWVLVNGTESFVNATVSVTDKNGKVISEVGSVKIDYKRGHLTTVRGEFLTAGKTGGGINIDTSWEDEFIVEF